MKRVALISLMAICLAGCWPENLENADFNVYIYIHPQRSGQPVREEYVGLVKERSACQAEAHIRASRLQLGALDGGWTYTCCKQTRTSRCESKHR